MEDKVDKKEIDKFRQSYYEQNDFEYWQERILTAVRRYDKLKSPKKKAQYIVEIYSIYIQVIEILLIHIHALSNEPSNFLPALNISNKEIRSFGEKIKSNKNFVRHFLHNFVYKIRGEQELNDRLKEKIDCDVDILSECLDDYMSDYNFLNSYKHGFRLTSNHGENYLAFGITPNDMARLFTGNSHLKYLEFVRVKDLIEVNEVDLTFNHMRIVGKAMFVIILLQNIQISVMASYKPKKKYTYPVFYISDKESWDKDFGKTRFKSGVFNIKQVK